MGRGGRRPMHDTEGRTALGRVALVCLSLSAPVWGQATEVIGPEWFQANLLFRHGFADGADQPTVVAEGLAMGVTGDAAVVPRGWMGPALLTDGAGRLQLTGEALSPCRPLTLSFWWALPRDLAIDGGFGLFEIHGKGFVGQFCRGKGEWCALQRPAGVFQVYYFDGIQNVNGIYDFDLMATLDLRADAWHHTAVVFRQASRIEAYTDGRLVFDTTTAGRAFRPDDGLTTLVLGGGILLDEVAILKRAVAGDMIADYYRGARQARQYLAE